MKITIIGCGNMGLIYARAFLKYNIVTKDSLLLVEKSETRKEELLRLNIGRVTVVDDPAIAESEIIILAVKPQDFTGLAYGLKKLLKPASLVVSIMAGIQISRICTALGICNVIRAMPNSPAELGMGMTAFTAAAEVPMDQVRKAENLLSTTGRTLFLHEEELLNAVTAVSGSGPAYFFYLVRHMIEAGKKLGFDEATSSMLVKQTMLGSFHLMNTSTKSLDELIAAVASKGGTTEAALSVFSKENVGEDLQKGIIAARDRARELSR